MKDIIVQTPQSTTLQRIKRITSHVGHARFLSWCDDTDYVIPRQIDIPSPYHYSSEWCVLDYQGKHVIIVETAHRRFDVFLVPDDMLILTHEE